MLDLAILGLLRDTPRHGYELKQQLAGLGFWKVSFGSLYPALRRLEKRELIEPLRVTGRRKAYQITPAGSAEFERLLPRALEIWSWRRQEGRIVVTVDEGEVVIELGAQRIRQIALLSLPLTPVTISWSDLADGVFEQFLKRFDSYYRRGGG